MKEFYDGANNNNSDRYLTTTTESIMQVFLSQYEYNHVLVIFEHYKFNVDLLLKKKNVNFLKTKTVGIYWYYLIACEKLGLENEANHLLQDNHFIQIAHDSKYITMLTRKVDKINQLYESNPNPHPRIINYKNHLNKID